MLRCRSVSLCVEDDSALMTAAKPACAPPELLTRRLTSFRPLSADDLQPLARLAAEEQTHAAGSELVLAASEARLVTAGLIVESRLLNDGRRQIVALRLPGDVLRGTHGANHVVTATAASRTLDASAVVAELEDAHRWPAAHRAWNAALGLEQRSVLDHVVRLGRFSAYERTAHLLLELHERLLRVKLANAHGFQLPITQEILADLLGLSIVHVNRTLQQLRRDGLLTYRAGAIGLPDPVRLADIAGYPLLFPTAAEPARRRAI